MKNLLYCSKSLMLLIGICLIFTTSCDDDVDETPIPEPTASFTFSPASPEIDQEITFTSTSENADNFDWSFGDGNTATGATATHSYTAAGDFTVTLVARGEGGNTSVNQTVTVTAPEPQADPVEVYFADNTGDVFTMQKMTGIGLEINVSTVFNTTGYTVNMIYDENLEKIFYSDDDNGQIVSVNLDGTSEDIIVSDLSRPRGLALNDDNTILYFVDRQTDEVGAVNLASGETTILYTTDDFNSAIEGDLIGFFPEGLAFYEGELFITCVDIDAEAVWKADIEGTNLERLLDFDEAGEGYGYSIIVDNLNEVVIFDNAAEKKLFSANFDGSEVNEIVATTTEDASNTYGLAFDTSMNKLYWSTSDGSIKRANRDGSDVETLLPADGERINRGLFVIPIN